jgi:putative addiction module component (TIGR02574 family)
MTPVFEIIEAAALRLSLDDRAVLVDRLLASLAADPEVAAAWEAEAERRQQEIESGAVSMLPGPETLADLKREFA